MRRVLIENMNKQAAHEKAILIQCMSPIGPPVVVVGASHGPDWLPAHAKRLVRQGSRPMACKRLHGTWALYCRYAGVDGIGSWCTVFLVMDLWKASWCCFAKRRVVMRGTGGAHMMQMASWASLPECGDAGTVACVRQVRISEVST